MTFQSPSDTNFPEYLRFNTQAVPAYNLRSSVAPLLSIPKESGTFQDTAETFFISLPFHVRLWTLLQITITPEFDPTTVIHRYFNVTNPNIRSGL